MTTTAPAPAGTGAPGRARIAARSLRTDNWWIQPAVTVTVLVAFIIYSTFRAFEDAHYFVEPYISPFYSPCITKACEGNSFPKLFDGPSFISPALYILIVPLGFRLTCYYYPRAYSRSFWLSPPACAVAEPHKKYTGETRVPLVVNNIHRYAWYFAMIFAAILTWDAVIAFDFGGHFGIGVGSVVLALNALFIWGY